MRRSLVTLLALLWFAPAYAATPSAPTVCPTPQTHDASPQWRHQYQWQALAQAGFSIGTITIAVHPIYDTQKLGQHVWYADLANALHITTRPDVIRHYLLLKHGSAIHAKHVYTAIRRLRRLNFIHDVTITPVACHGHQVDIHINVRDTWSFKPEFSFHRIGGRNVVDMKLEEKNFLGLGKTLAVGHRHGIVNNANYIRYADPALLGTQWQMQTHYAWLTQGYSYALNLEHPFVLDTSVWALNNRIDGQRARLNFYNYGKRAWATMATTHKIKLWWRQKLALSDHHGWRIGLRYRDEYSHYDHLRAIHPALRPKPQLHDHRWVGFAATVDYFQTRYASFHNLKMINRTEDYNLGWTASASLGLLPKSWGSTQSATTIGLKANYGTRTSTNSVLFFDFAAHARRSLDIWHNATTHASVTYYNQHFAYQTLVAHARFDWQRRPDPQNMLYMGGQSGLRGYHNFFRTGNRRWQLTLADRIRTNTVLMHTFRMGYVTYMDAGRMHRLDGQGWGPVFSNIGGGLRIGTTRFSYANVISLTLAIPLRRPGDVSRYQILLGNVLKF